MHTRRPWRRLVASRCSGRIGDRTLHVVVPRVGLVLHEVGFGETLVWEALVDRVGIVLDPGTHFLPGFVDTGVRGAVSGEQGKPAFSSMSRLR